MEQLLKVVDGPQPVDVFQHNSSVTDIATAQQVPRWLTMVQDVKPPDLSVDVTRSSIFLDNIASHAQKVTSQIQVDIAATQHHQPVLVQCKSRVPETTAISAKNAQSVCFQTKTEPLVRGRK
jgi:hypothetical protein